MIDLPPEILEQILTAIDTNRSQSFRYCSLVCSRWRGPAQRELFSVATFTITRLDHLVSSLDSITYTTLVEDAYLCSLIASVPYLRISLFGSSSLDPKFPDFLRLFTRVHELSLSHDTKRFLFDGNQFQVIKPSLVRLITSPTLTSIIGHSHGLPVWLIPACAHLKELQWIDIPSQYRNSRWNPFHGDKLSVHNLATIHLEGFGENIISFVAWLRSNAQSMPASQVKHVTFCFRTNPVIWKYPFSLFSNVTSLTLRFNQSIENNYEYNPHQLKQLESLKLETWLETAESSDPYKAMARIFSWLRPFTISPLPKLRAVQIQVFNDLRDRWDDSPFLLNAADLILERSDVMTRIGGHFPQLRSFSVYAPWLTTHHATRIFARSQTALPGAVFRCGRLPPGAEALKKTSGNRHGFPRTQRFPNR